MTAKERVISARIVEIISRQPGYAERIGISVNNSDGYSHAEEFAEERSLNQKPLFRYLQPA